MHSSRRTLSQVPHFALSLLAFVVGLMGSLQETDWAVRISRHWIQIGHFEFLDFHFTEVLLALEKFVARHTFQGYIRDDIASPPLKGYRR